MIQPWLSLTVLAACGRLAVAAESAGPCSRSATARSGDTCASLGQSFGLSVTDFLRANPGLGGCTLVPGSAYCVATDGTTATGVPVALPTTTRIAGPGSPPPPPPRPTGTLVPSPDGSDGICGGEYTCLGSVYGDCCSLNGYCGNTTDYCGEGCNSLFGTCGGGIAPECEAGSGATATITSYITRVQTQTVTKTVTAAAGVTTPNPVLAGTVRNCT